MSLWVLGTDTEIGKTVVSALLMARWGSEPGVSYWKPVATGSRDERDVETVASLCPGAEVLAEGALFREPLSPHLAARLEGRRIEGDALASQLAAYLAEGRRLVVEGVGGVLVPFDDEGTLLIDLVERSGLPALMVARSTLGTINHSLLTLEALRRRQIELAGAVLVGPPNEENRKAVERFGQIEVIAEIPWLEPLDAEAVRRAAEGFDREGRLAPFLTRPTLTGSTIPEMATTSETATPPEAAENR